jgi:chromosomal replication initiation ATPase DnaA
MPPKKKQIIPSIVNFYELQKVKKFQTSAPNPNYKNHHIKVPFRGILIGSSGSGKTNLLLNVIVQMANTFNHIYIYTKAKEPLYEYLESQFNSDLLTIKYYLDDCNNFKEADYYGSSLCIFDDMVNEKDQKCIQELFIRGRKIS